jgi:hypothetical protein
MDDFSLARPAGHLIMGDGSGPDGLAKKDGAKALSRAASVDTATTQVDKSSRTKNLITEYEHGLNLEIRLPTDVRWVDVRDADAPLLLGQTGDGGACLSRLSSQRAATAIGERPRLGRMLENGEHGGHTRSLPHQIAEAVTAGQQQVVGVEHFDDFTG